MFTLGSTSYNDKQGISIKYVHKSIVGGQNISPGFSWVEPPIHAKSFALSIVDPHPVARNWVHWLVINIAFRERRIVEGASRTGSIPAGAKELLNSYNEPGYGGPAPPKGSGPHPYVATLYALNVERINPGMKSSLREFEKAIEGKIIAETALTGLFERK